MISYTTELDFSKMEVRVIFNGDTATFGFNTRGFLVDEAIKVSAEYMVEQLRIFTANVLAEKGGDR